MQVKEWAGQDIREVSRFVDFVSPMCYSQMLLKRCSLDLRCCKKRQIKKAARKVLPSIQGISILHRPVPLAPKIFIKCLEEALKTTIAWSRPFFSWPLFTRDSSRMEAV